MKEDFVNNLVVWLYSVWLFGRFLFGRLVIWLNFVSDNHEPLTLNPLPVNG